MRGGGATSGSPRGADGIFFRFKVERTCPAHPADPHLAPGCPSGPAGRGQRIRYGSRFQSGHGHRRSGFAGDPRHGWPAGIRGFSPADSPLQYVPVLQGTYCREGTEPAGQEQVQRRSTGTSAITESTCSPQPAQVIFPQLLQRTGLHIVTPQVGWLHNQ